MFCFRLVLALRIGVQYFNSISELFDILKFRNLTELFGLIKEISHLKNASTMQQNLLLYMYFWVNKLSNTLIKLAFFNQD